MQNTFVYDVTIADSDGQILEQWHGLRLQGVRDINVAGALPAPLLGPYLERRIQEVIPEWTAAIIVEDQHQNERQVQSQRAIRRAICTPEQVLRCPSGKPEIASSTWQVSASHSGDLLVVVADRELVSCDAEAVIACPRGVWRDLLGANGFALADLIAIQTAVTFDEAATHVWTANECLTKADAAPGSPLVLDSCAEGGVILLSCGARRIATLAVSSGTVFRVFAFLCSI
jgi:enediyne polyketide synthase